MRNISGTSIKNSLASLGADLNDPQVIKQQLEREIASLESQLYRLNSRNDIIDFSTLQTYEDMILSRKRMLDRLHWDEEA